MVDSSVLKWICAGSAIPLLCVVFYKGHQGKGGPLQAAGIAVFLVLFWCGFSPVAANRLATFLDTGLRLLAEAVRS